MMMHMDAQEQPLRPGGEDPRLPDAQHRPPHPARQGSGQLLLPGQHDGQLQSHGAVLQQLSENLPDGEGSQVFGHQAGSEQQQLAMAQPAAVLRPQQHQQQQQYHQQHRAAHGQAMEALSLPDLGIVHEATAAAPAGALPHHTGPPPGQGAGTGDESHAQTLSGSVPEGGRCSMV